MKNKFTIKIRLTLWYIIILTLVLIAFSGFIYWNMEQYMYQEVKSLLKTQANQVVNELEEEEDDEEGYLAELNDEIKEMQNKNMEIGFYDVNKKLIQGKQIDKVLPLEINSTNKYVSIERKNDNYDQDWIGITLPIRQNGHIISWVRLVRLLENEEQILNKLMIILLVGVPIILIIASFGGYFLAWKALSPIDRITRTAKDISHNNLGLRLEEKETNDEVGRLTGTLNQLLERLEKAFYREKQFTADASHELRTPITVIRAQAEKALRNGDTKEGYQHTLEVIEKQVKYMSHLIDQLLLLARGDLDRKILEKEQFDLRELVEMVTDEIKEMAVKKDIKLTTDIKKEEIKIYADQSMLIQLLLNFLDNAIKYTPSGGQVTVKASKVEDVIEIQVADTGIGIPREDQENIFDRFYRVDKARSRKRGGTGLGLSICQWIVEAHGGNIQVSSQENEGSNFIIYLPS